MAVVTSHGAHLRSRSQGRPRRNGFGGAAIPSSGLIDDFPPDTTASPSASARFGASCARAGSRIDAAARAAASRAAAWHALSALPWRERPRVSLFWPLADEIDTLPLLHALHWLGAEPLLPRMQGRGRPLVFHAWDPELELVEGPFQVARAAADLPPVLPEIVLAPLLAFDRSGRRLGYGAGFYDMTFAAIAAAGGPPAARRLLLRRPGGRARAGGRDRRAARAGGHRGRLPHRRPGGRLSRMRILFVGDVVGRSGRAILLAELPRLRAALALDAVIVNGENAAGGYGLTAAIAAEFLAAGADVLTMGNHVWDQRELIGHIDREPRIVRPLNLAPGTPGRGVAEIRTARGQRVARRCRCSAACSWRWPTTRSGRSTPSSRGTRWAAPCRRSWSTSTPRPPARSWRWRIIWTAASRWSPAPTPTCRPPTLGSSPAAPATSPTSA